MGLDAKDGKAERARFGANRASAVIAWAAGCQDTPPRARTARVAGFAVQSASVRTSAESLPHSGATRSAAVKRTGQALSESASRIAAQSVRFVANSRRRSRHVGSLYFGGAGSAGNESRA